MSTTRKRLKTERINIRVDRDLLRRLKKAAQSHYRSPSEYARFLLEQALRDREAA